MTEHTIDVEGVGSVSFARRTMQHEINIAREYARVVGGVESTPWLHTLATYISVIRVLATKLPFVLDELDPLDEDSFTLMAKTYAAITAKESDFRKVKKQGNAGAGEGSPADAEVSVPQAV